MPVGMLGDERPQLPQIIARDRAALDAERFHWTDVLHAKVRRVQHEMSKLQPPTHVGGYSPLRSRARASALTRADTK